MNMHSFTRIKMGQNGFAILNKIIQLISIELKIFLDIMFTIGMNYYWNLNLKNSHAKSYLSESIIWFPNCTKENY